jgi:hypothetical protein
LGDNGIQFLGTGSYYRENKGRKRVSVNPFSFTPSGIDDDIMEVRKEALGEVNPGSSTRIPPSWMEKGDSMERNIHYLRPVCKGGQEHDVVDQRGGGGFRNLILIERVFARQI